MRVLTWLAVALAVMGVGGALAVLGSRRRRAGRPVLTTTPRVFIRHAEAGTQGKLVGSLVLVGPPLRAPLSGRPCGCWRIEIEAMRLVDGGQGWEPVLMRSHHCEFELVDGTGRVRVRPSPSPKLSIVLDRHYESGLIDEPDPPVRDFLDRFAPDLREELGRILRYHEGVIEPGERVAVLGRVIHEPDPDASAIAGGYRTATPSMRRVVVDPPDGPMHISDDPETLGL